jgi:hypothetical protein
MLSSRMTVRLVTACGALVCLALVGGCTGGASTTPAASAQPSTAATGASLGANAQPTGTSPVIGAVPTIPALGTAPVGIAKDVKLDAPCQLEPGKFILKGTVTNTAPQARDLQVVYNWVPKASSQTLARGVASLKNVKAGETKSWSMEVELKATAERCVLLARADRAGSLG